MIIHISKYPRNATQAKEAVNNKARKHFKSWNTVLCQYINIYGAYLCTDSYAAVAILDTWKDTLLGSPCLIWYDSEAYEGTSVCVCVTWMLTAAGQGAGGQAI